MGLLIIGTRREKTGLQGLSPNQHTISGPLSARQRNAIRMAFRWRADNGLLQYAHRVAIFKRLKPTSAAAETS